MKEEWRPVVGFEGLYEVSNLGNMRSLDRKCWNGVAWFIKKGRVLKQFLSTSGYKQVYLYKGNKRETMFIHRAVALAFLPNPDKLPQVNHIDEDKTNNRVTNLEWCTVKYNINYGSHNDNISKSMSYKVSMYDKQNNYLKTFDNAKSAALYLGRKSYSHIGECCRGKYKTAYGYKWKYVKEEDNNG